jgi:hypothetical protein
VRRLVRQAAELKQAFEENPYTWPNLLTLSRMLACPVLAYAIVHDQSALAGGLLVYAGVTDYVRERFAASKHLPTADSCTRYHLGFAAPG